MNEICTSHGGKGIALRRSRKRCQMPKRRWLFAEPMPFGGSLIRARVSPVGLNGRDRLAGSLLVDSGNPLAPLVSAGGCHLVGEACYPMPSGCPPKWVRMRAAISGGTEVKRMCASGAESSRRCTAITLP